MDGSLMRTERIQQALDRAEKKRAELPHIVQVHEYDHDTSVLADYIYEMEAAIKHIEQMLLDRNNVHVLMLRGDIARPSVRQIRHIYQKELDEDWQKDHDRSKY